MWRAEARLHCEPVPGRRAAPPDPTLIGFDTASRRREEAFLLLFFFFFFLSVKESFFFLFLCVYERPLLCSPLSSNSPLVLLCSSPSSSGSFSPLSLYVSILTPTFFLFSQIKTSGLLFLLSLLFYHHRHLDVDQYILILGIATQKDFWSSIYRQQYICHSNRNSNQLRPKLNVSPSLNL